MDLSFSQPWSSPRTERTSEGPSITRAWTRTGTLYQTMRVRPPLRWATSPISPNTTRTPQRTNTTSSRLLHSRTSHLLHSRTSPLPHRCTTMHQRQPNRFLLRPHQLPIHKVLDIREGGLEFHRRRRQSTLLKCRHVNLSSFVWVVHVEI